MKQLEKLECCWVKRGVPRPKLRIMSEEEFLKIHNASIKLLEDVGVFIDNKEGLRSLEEAGALVDGRRARIPRRIVEDALERAPKTITIYDRDGAKYAELRPGGETLFAPGSAAVKILDYNSTTPRPPALRDLVNIALIVENLSSIKLQSTAVIPVDVPIEHRDSIRLLPILAFSSKPIVTGAFSDEGLINMLKALSILREDYADKPMAIFDVCPSPPLKWSYTTCQNLLDLARTAMPAEIISMPQIGATGPATIAGSLIQHHAEVLSGIVMAETVNPGTPVIYGGSPSLFDMRYGTSRIAAPEAILLTAAYIGICGFLGLPCHAYLCLSDSKTLDYQAGMETLMGALIALLTGVNVASGPGMLEYESVLSIEKILLDSEVIEVASRILRGFEIADETIALDVMKRVVTGKMHYLTEKHTLKWYRREHYIPMLVDTTTVEAREPDRIIGRAREKVLEVLRSARSKVLEEKLFSALIKYFSKLTGIREEKLVAMLGVK